MVPVNYYAEHLAEINKTNTVTATENIYNVKGALIVAEGRIITAELMQKITLHKLADSLESCVMLESPLDHKKIVGDLKDRVQELAIDQFFEKLDVMEEAIQHFSYLTQHPLMMQKLTVLAERLPNIYNRSLISSVFSIALCNELNLNAEQRRIVFVGCVISDSGLLNINPDVVNKPGAYNEDEWRLFQGHVLIARQFVKLQPDINKMVGIAIVEHHERTDGCGYPRGLKPENLSIEGQIIGMTDTIGALFRKHVMRKKCSTAVLEPLLQINTSAHSSEVLNAALKVIRKQEESYSYSYSEEELEKLIDDLTERQQRLTSCFNKLKELYIQHADELIEFENTRPILMFRQLEKTMDTSGLLSEHQAGWLKEGSKNNQSDYHNAIGEYALLLEELEYYFNFINRNVEPYLSEIQDCFKDPAFIFSHHAELDAMLA